MAQTWEFYAERARESAVEATAAADEADLGAGVTVETAGRRKRRHPDSSN